MTSDSRYPRLEQMFGAFFHQDWDTEGDDWPDLVQNYAGVMPKVERESTADELDHLMHDFPDNSALDHQLFHVLDCNYLPRPDLGGPTVRQWLGQIAIFLRTGSKNEISPL